MIDFEHMTLSNNYMFNMVMRRKRLCKITLERILGIKIADISYPDSEKTVDVDLSAKSIRLDIYCEDDKSMYNIELQNGEYEDLPRRSRYYQSLMDVDELEKGHSYSELRKSIVIFICTFDFQKDDDRQYKFDTKNAGRHLYTFENVCVEDGEIKLNDGTKKIYLTTKSEMDDIPKELKCFLDYLESGVISDDFTKELDDAVVETRRNKKWRERIMTLEEYALARSREDILKAKEEGREEGRNVINSLVQMLIQDGRLDDLKKSTEDQDFQKQLIKEYGLGE